MLLDQGRYDLAEQLRLALAEDRITRSRTPTSASA